MPAKKIKYSSKIICFLDILGFKNLIEEAEKSPNPDSIISRIETIIKVKFEENVNESIGGESPLKNLQYKIFSDCISISIANDPKDVDQLFYFLYAVMYVQAEMTVEGVFIRGGIAIGNHFENERMIFSKALVNAYLLESKKANYPRILLAEEIVDQIRKYYDDADHESWDLIIKQDFDRLFFLDYLEFWREIDDEYDQIAFMNKHKKQIMTGLNTNQKSEIIAKYVWVAHYHNSKVDQLKKSLRDLKVPKSLLEPTGGIFTTHSLLFVHYHKSNPKKVFGTVFLTSHTNSTYDALYRKYPNHHIEITERYHDEKTLSKRLADLKKLIPGIHIQQFNRRV